MKNINSFPYNFPWMCAVPVVRELCRAVQIYAEYCCNYALPALRRTPQVMWLISDCVNIVISWYSDIQFTANLDTQAGPTTPRPHHKKVETDRRRHKSAPRGTYMQPSSTCKLSRQKKIKPHILHDLAGKDGIGHSSRRAPKETRSAQTRTTAHRPHRLKLSEGI